jgi:hypothetical protein
MDYTNLTDHEIKALLMQYDSEMRKLNFQMQLIQNTIQQLHEKLSGKPTTLPTVAVAKSEVPVSATVKAENNTKIKTETIAEVKNEIVSVPKIISGVEYPKKREPKIPIVLKEKPVLTEPKKRGPKPKVVAEVIIAEAPVEKKKRGRKSNAEKAVKIKSEVVETATVEKKKRGRKSNAEKAATALTAEKKKRGRKPGVKVEAEKEKRKYTKENPWPAFVIELLKKYSHALSSAQIYEFADEENTLKNYKMGKQEIRDMISRAFHQLANNKKQLAKFNLEAGKGYNYALTEWLDKKGELKQEFIP